jgi:protease I
MKLPRRMRRSRGSLIVASRSYRPKWLQGKFPIGHSLAGERLSLGKETFLMETNLNGKRVAILVADGFEQVELTGPQEALEEAGADTQIISPAGKKVRGWEGEDMDWGNKFKVDVPLEEASARNYDALLLPGGVMNPDKLRLEPKAIEFIREFFNSGKPIGAICHGPWTLIDAGVVKGKRLTSYPSIKNDLINAGAQWVDEEVVVDNGLVTSRKPSDIPAFSRKLVEEIAEGVHADRKYPQQAVTE